MYCYYWKQSKTSESKPVKYLPYDRTLDSTVAQKRVPGYEASESQIYFGEGVYVGSYNPLN